MQKTIKYGGSVLSYHICGEGFPVVLIHGFGEDGSVWKEQVTFLQNDFKLIVPDLPGSGQSVMLKKENAGIEDYADTIKAIADAENISQLIMIGHSMGGYITLAFAEKYPQYLKAFGLLHSGAYADDAEKIAVRKKGIQFIAQNGSAAFLKTSIPGLFFDAEKSRQEIEKLTAKGGSFLPAALIQYYEAMMGRPDRTGILKEFERPVLLIIGEHDKAIPFKHSLEQSHMPAKAHISILRHSSHMGMMEETEKVNETLAQFLHSI